jgi:hypothetical protein
MGDFERYAEFGSGTVFLPQTIQTSFGDTQLATHERLTLKNNCHVKLICRYAGNELQDQHKVVHLYGEQDKDLIFMVVHTIRRYVFLS